LCSVFELITTNQIKIRMDLAVFNFWFQMLFYLYVGKNPLFMTFYSIFFDVQSYWLMSIFFTIRRCRFSLVQRLYTPKVITKSVDGSPIPTASQIKSLGVILDSGLSFGPHISNFTRTAYFDLPPLSLPTQFTGPFRTRIITSSSSTDHITPLLTLASCSLLDQLQNSSAYLQTPP